MAEAQSKVEMEEVTVKVPKLLMDYLRKRYGDAIEWLEYELVATVKADVDSVCEEDVLSKLLGLDHVFKAVLDC